MTTEVNNEKKGKFLANYIGCEMLLPMDADPEEWCRAILTGVMNGGHEVELQLGDLADNASEEPDVIAVEEACALLKPLSAIRDKDAIKVAKILPVDQRWPIQNGKAVVRNIASGDEMIFPMHPLYSLQVFDFLRSRGYALPFMGMSVEQQIAAGWVKLVD